MPGTWADASAQEIEWKNFTDEAEPFASSLLSKKQKTKMSICMKWTASVCFIYDA